MTIPLTPLTYTLGGTDAASFDIVNSSGQLKTKAALDYATKNSYSVTVSVSDGTDTDSIAVTINVTNINEAPAFPDTTDTTLEVTKHTPEGTDIGDPVAATDPDGDTDVNPDDAIVDALTYTLGGDDADSFDIDPDTGQLKTKTGVTFDRTTQSSYMVTVTASDGEFTASTSVVITVVVTPVCDRTEQVRDAIVAEVPGVTACADVTETHLAAIMNLNLSNKSITALKAGDFDGLTALTTLSLHHNQISTLPAGVFDEITALTTLYLNNNQISTLPAGVFDEITDLTTLALDSNQISTLTEGVFDELTTLTTLFLSTNQISTLPAGVFDKLTALTALYLHVNQISTLTEEVFDKLTALTTLSLYSNQISMLTAEVFDELTALTRLDLDNNQISTLTEEVFEGLTALTTLYLHTNQISTLPAGVFEGLTALTTLYLNGNTVDPLPLTVSLKQVAEGEFKATAHTGAPFEMVLPVTVTNGTLDNSATTITIPIGNVESGSLTVTRTTGTTAAVTVDIGTLPGLPANHQGYALVKSTDLPLQVISETSNNAPEFTDGTETTREVAENTAAGENIGAAVSATDPNVAGTNTDANPETSTADTLTYTLSGTTDEPNDYQTFDIDTATGQLKTKDALDYETKTSYKMTVSVSDGTLSGTITLTINIINVNEVPTFPATTATTLEIAENTAANTNIGDPVTATDPDSGDTLTYSLDATGDTTFDIDSSTGQLKTSAALDFETKNSYTVTVTATDSSSLTATIEVTINITNVNEAPTFPATTDTTLEIAENTAAGTDIGAAVSATDPDVAGTNTDVNPDDPNVDLTYTLGGTDAASFDIVSTSGQLQTKVALDHETKASYSVTVTVSDGGTDTASVTVTISVTDVDETRPTVSITVPSGAQNGAFDVTVVFSEAVTGFVQSELVVTGTSGASITAWNPQTGGTDYEATITPTQTGTAIFNVAANVAKDTADNQNTAATQQTVQVDMTSPTVSITVPSGVQNDAFDVTVVFSEAVTGFVQSELVVTGTSGASITAWNPQTGGTDYKATITPTSSGTAIFNVAANVDKDTADNQNTAATQQTVQVNLTRPTVIINTPSGAQNGAFDVTVVFSEAVTGFVQSELVVTGTSGASITAWNPQTGGTDYEATITPTQTGTAIFNVAANVAKDTADNQNTAATQQTVQVDMTSPTVSITVPSGVQNGAFDATITFSEQVSLTGSGNITTADSLSRMYSLSGDGTTYTATFSRVDGKDGNVILKVPAGFAKDSADNLNTASDTHTVSVDWKAPTVTITDVPSGTQTGAFDATITFSEDVTGFEASDITLSGTATATATLTGSGSTYTATITPTISGNVVIQVPANAAEDAAGNGNTASQTQTVQVSLTVPSVTITGVPNTPQNSAFTVTFTFSEAVTGFAATDISLGSGVSATVTNFTTVSSTQYTATINPADNVEEEIVISVPAGAAQNATNTGNTASAEHRVQLDRVSSTVSITGPTGTQTGVFSVTITFSENVTGFTQGDITLSGTATATATLTGSGRNYTATITPTIGGNVVIQLPAGAAQDAATNGNNQSNTLTVAIDLTQVDPVVPTAGDTDTRPDPIMVAMQNGVEKRDQTVTFATFPGTFQLVMDFDRPVTGFEQSELAVHRLDTGVTVTGWRVSSDRTVYTATVQVSHTGGVTLTVPANAAQAVDDGQGNRERRLTVIVEGDPNQPNRAPVFSEGTRTNRTVAENTPSSRNIGSPVTATDADGDTLTYLLSGTDASSFSIDVETGQLQTQADLDYETKSSYTVTITVSDDISSTDALTDTITVTINVTDVDETVSNNAPAFASNRTTRSVAENTSANQNIGSPVSATDPDNDTLTYSLGGTDASSFAIVSTTGQLKTKAALDYETDDSYSATVSVSDGRGGTDTITVTINVTDVDETVSNNAPVFASDSTTRSVAENTTVNQNIGSPVTATDEDGDL